MDVYLEVGRKRTFASALEWPGWSRSDKDEVSALQALLDYGPRYQRTIAAAGLGFSPPEDAAAFIVKERLKGGVGTDFGAPAVPASMDSGPVSEAELRRFQALLQAMWGAFDATIRAAEGKELSKGPRGGGRNLEKIIRHVFEADLAYLTRLDAKFTVNKDQDDPRENLPALRQAILTALEAAVRGELPKVGPRGGARWTPRFYVRYSAWHLFDHTWEIEDRVE